MIMACAWGWTVIQDSNHLTLTPTSKTISGKRSTFVQVLTPNGGFDDPLYIGQMFELTLYSAHHSEIFQTTYQQLGMTILGLTAKTFVSRS